MNNIESIERLPKPDMPYIREGDFFELVKPLGRKNELYILAQVASHKFLLIELNTGNRWKDDLMFHADVQDLVRNNIIKPFKGVLIVKEIA